MSTSRPLADFDTIFAARAFERCFEHYAVKIALPPADFDRRFRAENVDAFRSRIVIDGRGEPVAVCLIARRGRTSRIAAMAVAPVARGTGLGKRLLAEAIADARADREERMVLEVLEGNAIARALYERAGFHVTRKLIGFEKGPSSGERAVPIDALDAARIVSRDPALDELPWQLQPQTLLNQSPHFEACAHEGAIAILAGRWLRLIYVPSEMRGTGLGVRLLRAIAGRAEVSVTPLVPERSRRVFERAGWTISAIAQFEMALDLDSKTGSSKTQRREDG